MTGSIASTDCWSIGRGAGYYGDQFRFSATAGDRMSILMDTGTLSQPYLYLLDPNGVVLQENCNSNLLGVCIGGDARIPGGAGFYTLPSTGTYTIDATTYSPGYTGAYTLSLSGTTTTGRIAGTVTNATTALPVANVPVSFYTGTGVSAGSSSTNAQGFYTSPGLPTGSYFARTFAPSAAGLVDELFDNISCFLWSCTVTTGNPVAVTAPATTANINFALTPGGRITGTVTNATTGLPVANVTVWFYTSTGASVSGSGSTDAQGVYTLPGLPTGSYFVRTSAPLAAGLIDALFDNIPCPCTVTMGSPVAVTAPATTGNINFALTPALAQRITTRVSVGTGGGQGNDSSYMPALSADGRFVAYRSSANNLVTGDTNGTVDVFVHDRLTSYHEADQHSDWRCPGERR